MKPLRKRLPAENAYPHIALGLVVVLVLVFVLRRDNSDEPDVTTQTAATAVATTQTTSTTTPQPTTTTTAAPVVTTTVTTIPEESPVVLNQSAMAYIEGLAGFKETLEQLVTAIKAANRAWDNSSETGVTYRETASALADAVDSAHELAESVRGHQVPSTLRSIHEGPDGPIEQAAKLTPLAEAVLAGLRIPAPDDGSVRRAALADFSTTADAFNTSVDNIIEYVDDNAEILGLTVSAEATTTTTRPAAEPSEEAVAYVEGLAGFKQALDDMVAEINTANQAWDNRDETGVTYRVTASALVEITGRARAFHEQVRDHPVPGTVVTLGKVPIRQAARLASLAEAVLAGLRIPAPEDGSARRAALADFNTAAEDFDRSVDDVVTYVDRNAEALGLTRDG